MSEETKTVRNQRRTQVGVVTSDAMDKTVKIKITSETRHPIYEKRIRHSATLTIHDEKNEAKVGDTIEVMETRRLSKTKCWRLLAIRKRAK